VHAVARDERVIEDLGDLVAQGRDVLESSTEEPGRDPARVVEDVALLDVPVAVVAGLEMGAP
jgi:hypothetical protein